MLPTPREDLADAIAATGDDQPTFGAPRDARHALPPHLPVRDDFLRANALLQAPEAYTGIMCGGDGLPRRA